METALRVAELEAGYSGKPIIHGITFTLPMGGAATIVGPNGSGKSTLLKALVGLLPPLAGQITLFDQDVTFLSAPERARLGMAYVAQENNVFRNMSVWENLLTGIEFMPGGRDKKIQEARRREVLDLFPELQKRLHSLAGHLSGGQRQMLAIASALMQRPTLLVLDEPSAGLSPLNATILYKNIGKIRATGISMLVIEQNVSLGLSIADTGIVMVSGQARLNAPACEITAEQLHNYYLGGGR